MNPRLKTSCLRVAIGEKMLCRNLDLEILPGQCWGILGPNGVGKTTLLHTLAGLFPPVAGTLLLNGKAMTELPRRQVARQIGMLFQQQSDPFPSTVMEAALTGRHPWLGRWQWESEEDMELVRDKLALVGLESMAARQVSTLSGGERQRLAIATLLAQQAEILLLDEPINHLDVNYQIGVLELLTGTLRQGQAAVIMVLHDINLAIRYCDHLLLLFPGGESVCGSTEKILDPEVLGRLYQHPMMILDSPNGPVYLPA